MQTLYISHNKITDCSLLGKLKNLQGLYINNNDITNISFLKNLNFNQFVGLDISYNKIVNLKPLQALIEKDIPVVWDDLVEDAICLIGNPFSNPTPEIIKQGNTAIIKYFEDLEQQGAEELYEAKLLIVGEGESGKTTLAWKLKDKNSRMPKRETERTEGIDVIPLNIKNNITTKKGFQMNIWDFGGQEIYHATHQFFLTKRSLYVIVNNTRSNLTDFNDWLQRISLLADNSPVIIVQNQIAASPTDLDLRGLQSQFSNIIGVYDVDLSNMKDGRFDKLNQAVQFHIQQLDHIGNILPKQWVIIRELLNERKKTETYISDKEFYEICIDNKIIKKEAIKRLSSFLHDLGVFLHFQDDPILKRLVILKNNWATKGVYKILDDKNIQNQKGHFSYPEIEALFQRTDFEDMHDELLSLMNKFELCYQIPDIKERKYVSPQLLSKEKPDYKWNNQNNLILYYNYAN